MRTSVAILAAVLLVSPAALSLSTRPVHDAIFDTFVPQEADVAAEKRTATINCGDESVPGQSDKTLMDTDHSAGDTTFDASGDNDQLDCWESTSHDLWTEGPGNSGKVVGAAGPFYTCKADGVDVELGLQNPFPIGESGDADPAKHGYFVSSGSFYVIPEITGADADKVDAIWFSFLETTPTLPGLGIGGGDEAFCASTPEGSPVQESTAVSGAHYEFYRGDTDKSDGWTIPINTLLVPDNVYGAELTAFHDPDATEGTPADLSEMGQPSPGGLEILATGYVYAIVENDWNDEQYRSCEPTRLDCDYQDTTPPWPQIVPGDVPQSKTDNPNQVTITYGEHIQLDRTSISIEGNAVSVPDSTSHDESDVDSVPLTTISEDKWGEQITFSAHTPLGRDLQPCDEITVSTFDLHGNQATKTIKADRDACGA